MAPGYYSRSLEGHRAAYLSFVISRFGGHRLSAIQCLISKRPILFLMIEENFGLYLLMSLWRSLLGNRTVGLLFRPGPAVEGKTWRLRLKRTVLSVLRFLPRVETLSIVPVPLDPRIGKIADGWVHDFQLWDLSDTDRINYNRMRAAINQPEDNSLAMPQILNEARQFANGRPLLVALGVQNRDKGADILATSMSEGGLKGWAVLVAGRFSSSAITAQETIRAHGGKVIDRLMSDDEMLALYAAADAIWCLYDPAYDQASGILGRAIQLGVPPVVRQGSLSEGLCQSEGIAHAAAQDATDVANALAVLQQAKRNLCVRSDLTERLASENDARIRHALGLGEVEVA